MAPPKFARLFSKQTVVLSEIEKVELIYRYIAPPWLSLCPLLVKLIFPPNLNVLSYAKMAPSCSAKLLVRLLISIKLDATLDAV